VIFLEMADHRLDGCAALELAFDLFGHAQVVR
jgi:hypothetical protein